MVYIGKNVTLEELIVGLKMKTKTCRDSSHPAILKAILKANGGFLHYYYCGKCKLNAIRKEPNLQQSKAGKAKAEKMKKKAEALALRRERYRLKKGG